MNILQQICEGDPIYLHNLIGKTTTIKTVDKKTHEGLIHVIDPVSKTVVLIENVNDTRSLKILMQQAVISVVISPEQLKVTKDFFKNNLLFNEDVEQRRVNLINWLKKNLIDVTEDGDLVKVTDDFSVGPPYTIDQCVCSNKMILERMMNLMDKMHLL